jgi:PAS domain S-box-containing protein
MLDQEFRATIERAQLGLADLDAEGRFTGANPAFLAMLGMREEELLGQSWRHTIHPQDQERAAQAHEQARRGGRGYVEVRSVRTDGAMPHQAVTITGVHDEHCRFAGYVCVRLDISGYKRDQETLTAAMETAPSGLLILSPAGEILSANRAVESLFGYARAELAGRQMEMLLPARFREGHARQRAAFGRDADRRTMAGRDLTGLRKDQREIPLHVYLHRIDTDSGERILCTIIDIAERLEYERRLQVAKQTAEAASRAKSDFLARMSHEIRTPMNLILGMTDLLLQSPLEAQQQQHVEIAHRNIRRLLRLINGILDLAKVESGTLTMSASPFDLRATLEECAATIAARIEQTGLHFRTSIDADVWPYWIGDAERLQQVLLNLIDNSIKFTKLGQIWVRVLPERGAQGEQGLRFEVSDTGCGIPPEKAAVIFEAFQQADAAADRNADRAGDGGIYRPREGTGLGLAISKDIVEMMSGQIWVESRPGRGSTFAFTAFLPLSTAQAVKDGGSQNAAAKAVRMVESGARILVAEDNAENQILIRAYLENLDVSLTFANDGVEAAEMRRQGDYDLVLMDLQMPVMDGYQAARQIRAWELATRVPAVPIVALTAHALIGASGESLEAGCDGHLTKPVERNDLIAAIGKFARRQSPPPPPTDDPVLAHRPVVQPAGVADLPATANARAEGELAENRAHAH